MATLRNDRGQESYVPIILRSPSHAGSVTVISATSTHQAYNAFGDHSLYRGNPSGTQKDRAHEVSFNRPFESNSYKIHLHHVGPIQHMESLGVKLSYSTSYGLELARSSTFAGSPAMVFLGHDEYWSVGMRSTVDRLRDRGTNLLFLGANSAFWRIRWSEDGQRITAYKSALLDPVKDATSTALFREAPFANPEAKLLGGQYVCNGVGTDVAPFVVSDPLFWAFAGTGVRKGQKFPDLIGYEIDQVSSESPRNVVIAGHSPYTCTDKVTRHSDFTYYTAASGAGVVNAGTFGFSLALQDRSKFPRESVEFARAVVANLVREAAVGPLGRRHPVAPVLDFEKQPGLIYITPGERVVNGRRWRTECEKYSQTQRCRTEIWATAVTERGGAFVKSNGWVFNNLTYLPMPTSPGWGNNPLANTGRWTDAEGRPWRTECGTAVTGSNGCRTWISASKIGATARGDGTYSYAWRTEEVMNNIVHLR